jgi:hypothetical protein
MRTGRHAGRQTDRQTHLAKLTGAFRNFAKTPKTRQPYKISAMRFVGFEPITRCILIGD